MIVDKYREVEDISGASCNKEITKEKSIRKEVRCARERIEDWAWKS